MIIQTISLCQVECYNFFNFQKPITKLETTGFNGIVGGIKKKKGKDTVMQKHNVSYGRNKDNGSMNSRKFYSILWRV